MGAPPKDPAPPKVDFALVPVTRSAINAAVYCPVPVNEEISDTTAVPGNGFRISDQPIWGTTSVNSPRDEASRARQSSRDLLYVIARDPQSLFLYWDLNWKRLFAQAGLAPRQVHLRIFRGNGSIEDTQEINPFRGHCYATVAGAGAEYYCELGCFDGVAWTALVRSGTTVTPEATMSDDLSGEFATLPMHLSFQKLVEILGTTDLDQSMLAQSVAELQENARFLRTRMPAEDCSKLAREIATRLNGANGHEDRCEQLAELIEDALRDETPAAPAAEELARWTELRERHGGSSWSGASKGGFGESSPD